MLGVLLAIPKRILLVLVRGYQLVISPHFPSSCNFQPTCSAYAIQAIERYGAVRGVILAIHRIGRCHPWGQHGHDPPVWFSERESRRTEEAPAPGSPSEEVTL